MSEDSRLIPKDQIIKEQTWPFGLKYLQGYCPICDNEVSSNQRFCEICGQLLEWPEVKNVSN